MMRKPVHIKGADVLGTSRLAIDATSGVVEIVEAVHSAVLDNIFPGTPVQSGVLASTSSVYAVVRTLTGAVGDGLDVALSSQASRLAGIKSTPEREAVLAALNGVVGDHLAATQNPLAIPMRLRRRGRALELERSHLAAAIPDAGGKVLLFVHGLCMNDLQWGRNGHNPGTALARELGWTPVHLHYNTGLHVSTNGRALAGLLEKFVGEWPVPLRELAIIGHSCGGLLARSAHYYGTLAGHRWPGYLRFLACLGTPHHGSALERAGNYVNLLLGSTPYSAPFGRIARIRSSGITDMRYGNLIDEDWESADRFHNEGDRRRPLPLPVGVPCFAIAASKGGRPSELAHGFGDGLVSLDSALGRHPDGARTLSFPPSHQWVFHGMTHWDLLRRAAVYRKLREWLAPGSAE
jgi:PGAP1-like protein